jgi:hypothetical protein
LQVIIESGSSFEKFIKKKQELNAAVSNLYKKIEQLEDMGIMIKSVDEGLLDFPSIRFNEEVGYVGKQERLKLNSGTVRMKDLWEESHLHLKDFFLMVKKMIYQI